MPRAILILAPDRVRRERAMSYLHRRFNTGSAAPIKRLKAKELGPREMRDLIDELFALSLFSPLRFFALDQIDELKSTLFDPLLKALGSLPEKTLVFFTGSKLRSNSRLRNFFSSEAHLIEFPELKGGELSNWISRELARAGISSYPPRLPSLIAEMELTPDAIAAEVEKLALFCETSTASESEIGEIFRGRPSAREYAMVDAVTAGRCAEAELLVTHLLDEGTSPFLLLGIIGRVFLNYFALRKMEERGATEIEIGKALNMPAWLLQKNRRGVSRYSADDLERCLSAITAADRRIKDTSLGPDAVMSSLLSSLSPISGRTP